MDFKKKLKSRLYFAIGCIALGIVMVAVTFIIKTDNSYTSAFGLAMIVMGLVRVRNYRMITKDEETIKKQQIIETDERNLSILNKARSTAFVIYLSLMCIFVIVLSLLNMHEVAKWIEYSVCLLLVIHWICYLVYQKRS